MPNNKSLTIGFDLDAIVIDLLRPWLKWYNDKHDDNITVDDIKTYKVENYTKKTRRIFDFFADDHYSKCPVLPGASEGLHELMTKGHDIIIASATAGSTAQVKWHLVKKAAPWLHADNVMVGSRKERLFLDVFVDDAPKNVVKYRKAWPDAKILTIAYPYNQEIRSLVDLYAMDHNNTVQAWRQICDFIHELADAKAA